MRNDAEKVETERRRGEGQRPRELTEKQLEQIVGGEGSGAMRRPL